MAELSTEEILKTLSVNKSEQVKKSDDADKQTTSRLDEFVLIHNKKSKKKKVLIAIGIAVLCVGIIALAILLPGSETVKSI